MARSAALIVLVLLASCAARDLELLPITAGDGGTDAGSPVDSGSDSGAPDAGGDAAGLGSCLNGRVDCSMCPPAQLGDGGLGTCAAACDIGAGCTLTLTDGATGPGVCGDGGDCSVAAEALLFCRGPSAACLIDTTAGGDLTCLEGECRFTCAGPCQVDCPGGNCQLDCPGGGCSFRPATCPVPILPCGPNVSACAPACAG